MAEEQIKIRIQADAADFKTIMDAVNAKLAEFGKTATIVAGNVKVVQKDLDNTSNSFAKVGDAAQTAGEKMKTANQGYTHLALVLQDLPFGFRGIQNNLPALVGDIAGAAGPIYLLSSAIIAFFTAYDMGAFGAKKSTDAWAESVKKAKDELHDAINYTNTSTNALKGLVTIGNDYTLSEQLRLKAFKEIKDELGKVNKVEADKIKNMADATSAVTTYTEAVKAQQFIEITGKRLAELEIQNLKDRAVLEAQSGRGIHPLEFFGLTESDATAASKRIAKTIGEIRLLEEIQSSALKANLNNPYSEFNKPDKNAEALSKKNLTDRLKAIEQINKGEQEGYLATLSNQQKEEYIVNEKYVKLEALAIKYKQSTADLETARLDEIAKIKDTYDKKEQERNDKSIKANIDFESKIYKDSLHASNEAEKEKARINKEFIKEYNSDLKEQAKELDQFYKTKLNLATGDLASQKEILKQQRADLEVGFVLDLISWDTYTKAVGENVKAVANVTAKMTKESLDSLMKIGNGIMSALGPSLDMLLEKGASIGDVLTNAFHSLINQLAKVAIAAAIAVALISILFPGTLAKAGGALKLFSGLIGQGMGIGGLIGGGVGAGTAAVTAGAGTSAIESLQTGVSTTSQLTARVSGNDLLILMNKAQRNNNVSF